MRSRILPALLLLLSLGSCHSRDPLADAKAELKKKYETAEAGGRLAEVPAGRMEVKPATNPLPISEVIVKGAVITTLKEESRKDREQVCTLDYPAFKASVVKASGGNDYASLPAAWGADDLAKIDTVMRTSGKSIDSATTAAELEDVVLRLASKGAIAPLGASFRTDRIEGPGYEGLLCGDFKQGSKMSLLVRPKGKIGISYRIDFWAEKGSDRELLKDFLAALKVTLQE